jgi:hypothetical protein
LFVVLRASVFIGESSQPSADVHRESPLLLALPQEALALPASMGIVLAHQGRRMRTATPRDERQTEVQRNAIGKGHPTGRRWMGLVLFVDAGQQNGVHGDVPHNWFRRVPKDARSWRTDVVATVVADRSG